MIVRRPRAREQCQYRRAGAKFNGFVYLHRRGARARARNFLVTIISECEAARGAQGEIRNLPKLSSRLSARLRDEKPEACFTNVWL